MYSIALIFLGVPKLFWLLFGMCKEVFGLIKEGIGQVKLLVFQLLHFHHLLRTFAVLVT
jgi:hypothetical protein